MLANIISIEGLGNYHKCVLSFEYKGQQTTDQILLADCPDPEQPLHVYYLQDTLYTLELPKMTNFKYIVSTANIQKGKSRKGADQFVIPLEGNAKVFITGGNEKGNAAFSLFDQFYYGQPGVEYVELNFWYETGKKAFTKNVYVNLSLKNKDGEPLPIVTKTRSEYDSQPSLRAVLDAADAGNAAPVPQGTSQAPQIQQPTMQRGGRTAPPTQAPVVQPTIEAPAVTPSVAPPVQQAVTQPTPTAGASLTPQQMQWAENLGALASTVIDSYIMHGHFASVQDMPDSLLENINGSCSYKLGEV